MPRKAFLVEVELSMQTVTCPGVWLCPNGKVSLQIHMLGSCIQTHSVEPSFPLVLQEKFVFSRTYFDVCKLATLQNIFNKDILYIELIQWQNCENGNVLATFKTTLGELLFPESKSQSLGNAEVDLLMEPMKHFPGILAPKIEVSTRTTIQDKIYTSDDGPVAKGYNPMNILTSYNPEKVSSGFNSRQKPVCHTKRCQKLKPCGCNNETRDGKRSQLIVRTCRCTDNEQTNQVALVKPGKVKQSMGQSSVRRVSEIPESQPCPCCSCTSNKSSKPKHKSTICKCGDTHSDNCIVCAKYKHYFENKSLKSQKRDGGNNEVKKCYYTSCECSPQESEETICLCNYPATRQSSTAQKMHARLKGTLNQCNCQAISKDCLIENCNCDDLQDNCTETLGQFYKKLYSCKCT